MEKISNLTNIFQMGWNHQLLWKEPIRLHYLLLQCLGRTPTRLGTVEFFVQRTVSTVGNHHLWREYVTFFPAILRKSWPYKSLRGWSLKGWEPLPRRVVGWNSIRYPVVCWHGKQPHLSHLFLMNTIETADFSLRDPTSAMETEAHVKKLSIEKIHWFSTLNQIFEKQLVIIFQCHVHTKTTVYGERYHPPPKKKKLTWQCKIRHFEDAFPIENGFFFQCHLSELRGALRSNLGDTMWLLSLF